MIQISLCEKTDFDQIVSQVEKFWGNDRTLGLHHPIFVNEFGNTAYVIREGTDVVAYLFGFFSQTEPTVYVHLVGTRVDRRRKGLARQLYAHLIAFARTHHCTAIKAITTPHNKDSIAFHRALGFELLGKPNREGLPMVENYSGLGQDRVVFLKNIHEKE
jgi:GNAT superfamily N-acetyltransferase